MVQEIQSFEEEFVEKLSSSLSEPSWLKEFRLESLRQFKVLPEEKSNLYTKYALNLDVDFKRSAVSTPAVADPTAAPISELASGMESGQYYVSTQTETIASKNVKSLESKGVIFCDYHEALEKHAEILKKIFSDKAIKPSDDKYGALNSALFTGAWLLYVPKNVHLEEPLRIRFYLNSSKPYFSQTWVYAEPNTELSLLTESYGA